jgi:tRNA(fMet)-specific endonuclease VapC
VNYLLDTNACIALINGTPPAIRPRLEWVLKDGASVAVSAVVAFELWYGAAKSARRQANRQRLETFFAGPLELVPSTTRTPAPPTRSGPRWSRPAPPSALTTC